LLVVLGSTITFKNSSSPVGWFIGLGMVAVGLLGFVHQRVVIDSTRQTLMLKRSVLGLGVSAHYPLRSIKGVSTKLSKFGDVLVFGISEGRRHRVVRIAGPTRADLSTVVQEVRDYLAATTVRNKPTNPA
jgi:hypothetical protein